MFPHLGRVFLRYLEAPSSHIGKNPTNPIIYTFSYNWTAAAPQQSHYREWYDDVRSAGPETYAQLTMQAAAHDSHADEEIS